jgi:hypothetical protein
MNNATTMTAADLYTRIADTFVADAAFEQALLADFDGAVAGRFGIKLPKPAKLVRVGSGFRLTYDGQDYDLGDPRTAAKGELNDAELELVSAGGNECPKPDVAGTEEQARRVYGRE